MTLAHLPWSMVGRVVILAWMALALWSNPVNGAWGLWALSYGGIGWWSSARAQNAFGIQGPALWSAWCIASGIRLLPDVHATAPAAGAWGMPHAYALCAGGIWLALQVLWRYRKGTTISTLDL